MGVCHFNSDSMPNILESYNLFHHALTIIQAYHRKKTHAGVVLDMSPSNTLPQVREKKSAHRLNR
jgi:hypothetical protein